MEFYKVARTFLGVLHEVLLVEVLCEVGLLYLLVHNNLLYSRSLHEVVRKLPLGLRLVVLHCRYWADVLHFHFSFDVFCVYIFFQFCVPRIF